MSDGGGHLALVLIYYGDGCGCLYVRLVFISGSGSAKNSDTVDRKIGGKIRQRAHVPEMHCAHPQMPHSILGCMD